MLKNFEILFNEKDKKEKKNILLVYADKEKVKKLKIPGKLYNKENFEKNKPIILAPYRGYKKLIVIPYEKRKLSPYLLSKIAVKVEEDTTIDLRALKEYQSLMIEFIMSKSYKFAYKNEEEDKKIRVNFLTTKKDFSETLNKLEALYFARDLINEPSNIIYPKTFVEKIKNKFKDLPVEIEIFDKEKLEKENFNLLLSVAKGSSNEPYLVVLKYLPNKEEKPTVLVGKGVCFDTGGYYVKPYPIMNNMHMDMGGAAVVAGTVYSLAKNNIKKNVIALLPLVENAINGNAYKPGDIVKSRSGKYVEIAHTDAEGRLILADAIDYATEFNPKKIITVATLTGAAIIALGDHVAAVMSNNEKETTKLTKIGLEIEERVWPLPLWDEIYLDLLKSDVADIRNISNKREAGTILGGLFLKQFAKDFDFVHLDIAGPCINDSEFNHLPKGGTAFGLRLLYEFIKRK